MIKQNDALSGGENPGKNQIAICSVLTDVNHLSEEHFKDHVLSPRTFLVQSQVSVNTTITIAKNVTLIFQGGRLVGNGTIIGDKTKIVAGPIQIFGENLTIDGKWSIDRAYPQWFDSKVGTDTRGIPTGETNNDGSPTMSYNNNPYDCSIAINKAIKMKQAGEVHLPSGIYYVSHTINVLSGTMLTGDGFNSNTNEDYIESVYCDDASTGTTIIPFMEFNKPVANCKDFLGSDYELIDGFKKTVNGKVIDLPIVAVNLNVEDLGCLTKDNSVIDSIKPKIFSSANNGHIRDIYFNNFWYHTPIGNKYNYEAQGRLSEKICCLVAYGYTFEHSKWQGFRRAVKWMDNDDLPDLPDLPAIYTDMKAVVRCTAMSYGTSPTGYIESLFSDNPPTEPAYQFDLSGLGDALIFDGNHVTGGNVLTSGSNPEHPTVTRKRYEAFRALKIHKCHGGSVTNNILNNSVDISQVTGMEFANNHLELRGASLTIKQSNITVRDNFFEKNSKPCIVIDSGIRSHIPDNKEPEDYYSEYNADNNIVTLSNNNFVLMNHDGRTPVWELSEYDIIIDAMGHVPTNLHLKNNYRTDSNNGRMSFQTVGINIGLIKPDSSIVPFEEFNDHSYILSYDGSLLRSLELVEYAKISNVEDPYIRVMSSKNIIDGNTIKGDIEKSNPNPSREPATKAPWPYKYEAQIIFDKTRGIAYTKFDAHTHVVFVDGKKDYNTFISNIGIEMHFEKQYANSPRMNARYILRIVRTPYISSENPSLGEKTKDAMYVDIPMCGCATLHDNHKHVNGYPWKMVKNVNNPFLSNPYSPKSIEFVNGNVKCIGGTLPETEKTDYKWVEGDECKVIIDDDTIVSYYFHNGKWVRSY